MTNFDFLKNEPKFKDFADVAISAERIFQFDYAASVLNCRRAMEFAVKWMYSVDSALVMPWDDRLVSLMSTDEFRDIIDADLLKRMEFIRKIVPLKVVSPDIEVKNINGDGWRFITDEEVVEKEIDPRLEKLKEFLGE